MEVLLALFMANIPSTKAYELKGTIYFPNFNNIVEYFSTSGYMNVAKPKRITDIYHIVYYSNSGKHNLVNIIFYYFSESITP
jgi:hypothetical protein